MPESSAPQRISRPLKKGRSPEHLARPQLELLEDRTVPTVTYHGGNLLYNVQVQGVYLGSDWLSNPYYNQTGYMESFLYTIVNSPFMDTLGKAGYYVGRGSYSQGIIDPVSLYSGYYLDDSSIQSYIQSLISGRNVRQPNSESLYVVYVEDNIVVRNGQADSRNNFLGYHGAFYGYDANGYYRDIRYAVIPYHGTNGNAQIPWLGTLNSLTEVSSHEIAEAATDPDVSFATSTSSSYLGWYDDNNSNQNLQGEVGDITNGSTFFYNGYAMQRISDPNDQPMTPQGASPMLRATFLLQSNGLLYEHTAYGWSFLTSGVAKISDQGIDNHGRAMIDVMDYYGDAYEYHDGSGFVFLSSGVYDAKAGQGVSYLLFRNGNLYEYSDRFQDFQYIVGGISAIDAGTDGEGVNSVALIYYGYAYEYSDSSGYTYLGYNATQISAGQQGWVGFSGGGTAFVVDTYDGAAYNIGGGLAYVQMGVDAYGGFTVSAVTYNDAWYVFDQYAGYWAYQASGIGALGKQHNGTFGLTYAGYGYEQYFGGYTYLAGYVSQVV